jgi:hypothetical protein
MRSKTEYGSSNNNYNGDEQDYDTGFHRPRNDRQQLSIQETKQSLEQNSRNTGKGGEWQTGKTKNTSHVDSSYLLNTSIPSIAKEHSSIFEDIKKKFERLKNDQMAVEYALKEHQIIMRELPSSYINFLEFRDHRNYIILALVLYQSIREQAEKLHGEDDSDEEIDFGLIEQLKKEVIETQQRSEEVEHQLEISELKNQKLAETILELKNIILNLFDNRKQFSQWIEAVVCIFTSIFRIQSGLSEQLNDAEPELEAEIRKIITVSEFLEGHNVETLEEFELFEDLLSVLEQKNQSLRAYFEELNTNCSHLKNVRYFLSNLGQFSSNEDKVEKFRKQSNEEISALQIELQ